MIDIYVLEGCDKCKKLKTTLTNLKIKYNCISCESDPIACDEIENITGVDSYPMVNLNGRHILYIAEKYSDVGKIKVISDNLATMGMYSVDNIIDAIKV